MLWIISGICIVLYIVFLVIIVRKRKLQKERESEAISAMRKTLLSKLTTDENGKISCTVEDLQAYVEFEASIKAKEAAKEAEASAIGLAYMIHNTNH